MFSNALAFNQDLNNWDVSKVANMEYMFSNAYVFNGNISGWECLILHTHHIYFLTQRNLIKIFLVGMCLNYQIWLECFKEQQFLIKIFPLGMYKKDK